MTVTAKVQEVVDHLDSLDARLQEEIGMEDFSSYCKSMEAFCVLQGFKFVKLTSDPMMLKFKEGDTSYTVTVKGDRIEVAKTTK